MLPRASPEASQTSRLRARSGGTITGAPASAQPFTWLLPSGGETWTAGTTHTVEWSGGPASTVNVYIDRLSPFQVADVVGNGLPNTGFAYWTIPSGLTPGAYQVYVED